MTEQEKQISDELLLKEMQFKDGKIDMRFGGDGARRVMDGMVEFFEQNGGKNFLTFTLENTEKRYAITIQNLDGEDSPSEKINRLTSALDERDREVERLRVLGAEWGWEEDKFQEYGGWDKVKKVEEENQRLRKALLTVCHKIVAYGGTVDKPRRMTLDEMLEVYDIARKASAGEYA